jgi:F0F1-type ATP synthase epsilon subunit
MSRHQQQTATFNVSARAPFHIYYEGAAKMVSGENQVGRFDILPGHADFFSVMTNGEVVIETDKDTINFQVSNGIISVHDSDVMLFVNI